MAPFFELEVSWLSSSGTGCAPPFGSKSSISGAEKPGVKYTDMAPGSGVCSISSRNANILDRPKKNFLDIRVTLILPH
jgi:hypothetical protein